MGSFWGVRKYFATPRPGVARQIVQRKPTAHFGHAGIPDRTIAHVLCDTDQRRPALHVLVH